MAPAASEEIEEQEKEETDTDTPAAPDKRQQQDVASMVGRRTKKKIEEAISLMGSCHVSCSEMLQAARQGHVGTGDIELRCLEFIESELNYIIVYLNEALMMSSQQHVGDWTMLGSWLGVLTRTTSMIVPHALDEIDPQRQNTLLQRVLRRRFHRTHGYPHPLKVAVASLYHLADNSCRYIHLAATATNTSGLGLPHQEPAEESMGIVDWFKRLLPPTSCDHLPYKGYLLTLCMIMFPYGHKFEKGPLIEKWFCEAGMLLHHFGSEASALAAAAAAGHHCFSDLVDRSAIIHAAANSNHRKPDEAEAWQWNVNNPLKHQYLASKSAEMGFAFTSATLNFLEAASASAEYSGNETNGRIPRRLALHHDDPNIPSLLEKVDLSQTRSLAVSGPVVIGVPLDKFANLVVLDVQGWENFGDDDLLRICRGKMFFLLYLSIRNTRVSKVPPEIKELHSLQVLDASYTQVTELQLGVLEKTELRRLDLRGTPIRQLGIPNQNLRLESGLQTLLHGVGGVISSTVTTTTLPHDIRRFTRLGTLATVDLSEQPASFINALGDLRHLRVLAITWSFHQSSDRDYCEALLSSIREWKDLESLTIYCGLGCSMEFLGCLSGQPQKLEKFKVIAGRFADVPQWFRGLKHLSFVKITVCKLGARDLEILRYLPKLKCLVLGLDFIPREAIVINNEGFCALQRFSMECPVSWLTFESGAMPELTCLQLNLCDCPTSPISVPSGISNLSRLTEVTVWYNARYANSSSIKMVVEGVRKEVAKRHNTSQVISLFINGIEQDDCEAINEETGNARAPTGTSAVAEVVIQKVDEITEA